MVQTDGEGNASPTGPSKGSGSGGTGVLSCTADDFKSAADGFLRIHDELSAVVSQLAGVLKGCGGMAGSDTGAEKWADKYDPACGGRGGAEGAMETASDVINGAGMMHDLLAYTGADHHNTDNPDAPMFPPGSPPVFKVPSIPKAFGGGSGGEPAWWSLITQYIQGVFWPNGHQDKLKEAAQAYRAAASGARCAKGHIPGVIALVNQQGVPEAPTITSWCARTSGMIDTLAEQFEALGKACEEQAHNIDEAHKQITDAAKELAWQTVLIEVGGVLAGIFSAGFGEAGAQAIEASRIAAIAEKILGICRAFAVAAEACGLPLVESVGALTRVAIDIRPLLTARAVLYGGIAVEDAAAVGDLEQLIKYNRPYLRNSTKEFIEANAKKQETTVDGKTFYRSATDDNVLMPKDKTWEGKTVDGKPITSLEKDSTGKYYVDAHGTKYPVDPKWHYGHDYDHEWWRIQEEARNANPPWTQKQMNDYINDHPEIFRIEDAPGNQSHQFERARE